MIVDNKAVSLSLVTIFSGEACNRGGRSALHFNFVHELNK